MVLPKRERERERERVNICPIEREIIFTDFERGDLRERERERYGNLYMWREKETLVE